MAPNSLFMIRRHCTEVVRIEFKFLGKKCYLMRSVRYKDTVVTLVKYN